MLPGVRGTRSQPPRACANKSPSCGTLLSLTLLACVVTAGCAGGGEVFDADLDNSSQSRGGSDGDGDGEVGSDGLGTNDARDDGDTSSSRDDVPGSDGSSSGAGNNSDDPNSNAGDGADDGSGASDDGVGADDGSDGQSGDEQTLGCLPEEVSPDVLPLRRLTTAQFRSSLEVILPGVDIPELFLPAPNAADGFTTNALSQPNNALLIDSEFAATDEVAARAVAQLDAWAPCSEQSAECLSEIAGSLAPRAYRRLLTPDEAERLDSFAQEALAASDFETAAHDLVQAILLSPQTLYRVEFGSSDGSAALSGEEVATRLSFFLWRQAPDEMLLQAARSGELDDADGVAAHARRMFQDERAQATWMDFTSQWLRLDMVSQLNLSGEAYPELTEELRQSLRGSIERFIEWALWEENSLDALLRSDVVFVDEQLANLLGVPAPGSGFEPVSVEHRHGILTQPGVLASTSHGSVHSPILRGLKVLESFLCVHIAAPPPEVNAAVEPKPEGSALTTRQHVEETHSGSPECAGCHTLIDGVGFAFENYDALGRYVTEEDGTPVDPSGIAPLQSGVVDVADGVELAQILESSAQVRECVSEHLYRYALGASPNSRGTECLVEDLASSWESNSGDPAALIDRLVRSDVFRHLASDSTAGDE